VPPSILFIPMATVIQATAVRFADGVDSGLSDAADPVSTWLLWAYFKTIPFELEECALIDGASRWQILIKISCRWRARADLGLHLFGSRCAGTNSSMR